MSLYVAAYDVASDTARERVARLLLSYGQRLQRSVFLISAELGELEQLRRDVGPWLAKADHFDLIPVDTAPSRRRWSWQKPPDTFAPVLLG